MDPKNQNKTEQQVEWEAEDYFKHHVVKSEEE